MVTTVPVMGSQVPRTPRVLQQSTLYVCAFARKSYVTAIGFGMACAPDTPGNAMRTAKITKDAARMETVYVGEAAGEMLGLGVGVGDELMVGVGRAVGDAVGLGAGGLPPTPGGLTTAGIPPFVLHAESETPTAAASTRAKSGPKRRVFLRMTHKGY